MSKIKRYSIYARVSPRGYSATAESYPDKKGEWVKFSDLEKLAMTTKEAEEQLERSYENNCSIWWVDLEDGRIDCAEITSGDLLAMYVLLKKIEDERG
jgi:hypothetical protein